MDKKRYSNYSLKTKIFPKLNENESVTPIPRTEKKTTLKIKMKTFTFAR